MYMETRNVIGRFCLLIIISISFNLFSLEQSSPGISDLRSYLPSEKEAGEWKADGPPQEFKGEDLYLYIDGGAEIYREYGFAQALVQEYKNREGEGLSLEIFQMTSPEGAYGMYTFKRSAQGTPIAVEAEGQLEDYYLNFWKGHFVVTITGYDKDQKGRQGLLGLAHVVSKKIRDYSAPPLLVAELPQADLIKTSIRYFRGYLGFMNNYLSLAKEEFRFQEAVKGDYSSGASLFILKYAGEGESRRTFSSVEKAIMANPKSREFTSRGPLYFRMLDDRGKFVSIRMVKSYILVCLENTNGNEASSLFEIINKTH